MSQTYRDYPTLLWSDFIRRFRWEQGEHVLVIGPTGQGKTTLLSELVPYRGYNLMLGTKMNDSSYHRLLVGEPKFIRVDTVDQITPLMNHVLLWPKYRGSIREFKNRQAFEFQKAMNWAAAQGGWTVWNDEELYMCKDLKLEPEVTWFLQQARSSKLTIFNGAQRPAWIPLASYGGSTHCFLWAANNDADAKRLADLGMVDPKELAYNLRKLPRFHFVYVNTRTGASPVISTVDLSLRKGVTNGGARSPKRYRDVVSRYIGSVTNSSSKYGRNKVA